MLSVKEVQTGTYEWANGPMLAFLGAEGVAALSGRTDAQMLPAADAQCVKAGDLRAVTAGQSVVAGEHRFDRSGRTVDVRAHRMLLAPSSDQKARLLTIWTDATERRRNADQLQRALAQIERHQVDYEQLRKELTKGGDRPVDLFRREHFEEHLRREVALSQREQREFALLLVAVDRLEVVRDRFGPVAVSRVSDAMAQILRSGTRAMDVLAQLADDRYAVLLSGVGLAIGFSRAEHLRRACAAHVVVQDGQSFGFEVTVGVASFPHNAQSLEELSQVAIRALNQARTVGGNRVAAATVSLADCPL